MRRNLYLIPLLLFFFGVARAYADPGAPGVPELNASEDLWKWGPVGALIWSGILVGRTAERGFKLSIAVSLDPQTGTLLERLTMALERISIRAEPPASPPMPSSPNSPFHPVERS